MKAKSPIRLIRTTVYSFCLILALAGCTATTSTPPASASDAGSTASVPSPSESTLATQSTTTDDIGADAAKSIALEHANLLESDVQFVQSRLEHDDGRAIYEVEFWSGNTDYDYDIDAVTGEIIGFSQDVENNAPASPQSMANSATPATASTDYITDEQAKEIALQDAGINASDAQNLRCELENDDGRAEYELEWDVGGTEYDYTINAIDGTILERDVD